VINIDFPSMTLNEGLFFNLIVYICVHSENLLMKKAQTFILLD